MTAKEAYLLKNFTPFQQHTTIKTMNQDLAKLKKAIKQINPVLVIGDLMLDEYHWCEVSRISPEAPVPVCKVKHTTLTPGGAGNVASNIQQLGVAVEPVGMIGADSSGEKLQQLFKEKQIKCDGIFISKRPTILKSRIVAHQQQVVRLDREGADPLTSQEKNRLIKHCENVIPTCSAVIISDYQKGLLTETGLKKIISVANQHNKVIVVDPKGDSFSKYKQASVITPNFKEFQAVVGKHVVSEDDIFEKGKKLVKKLGLDALLLTRSEKGLSIITEKEKKDIPTTAREVFDITGAGDTVVAVLSIGLASGLPLEAAANLANVAAGIVVQKQGTATVSLEEIDRFLR